MAMSTLSKPTVGFAHPIHSNSSSPTGHPGVYPGPGPGMDGFSSPNPVGLSKKKKPVRKAVFRGKEAVEKALIFLQDKREVTVGAYKFYPGKTWGINHERMFLGINDYIYYSNQDVIWRIGRGELARDDMFQGFSEGAKKAAWLEQVGKVQFAFLTPLVVTILGTIGTIASVAIFVTKLGSWCAKNSQLLELAAPHAKRVLEHLKYFADHCPKLALLMVRVLTRYAVTNMPKGFSDEDVAYFLGKVMSGIGILPAFTLGKLAKVLGGAIGATVALRGAGAITRGVKENIAKDLVDHLKKNGINLSQKDAQEIIDEGCLGKKVTEQKLRELDRSIRDLAKIVDAVSTSLRIP